METLQGTVVNYSRQTGWGFIRPDKPANPLEPDLPDFFVCYKFIEAASKWAKYLKPGQRVEFTPVDVDFKPVAHNVRLLRPITIALQVSGTAVQS